MQNLSQFKSKVSDILLIVPSLHDELGNREARRIGSEESNSDWELRWAILFTGSVSVVLWAGIGILVWLVVRL
jgi:hypothetical protein